MINEIGRRARSGEPGPEEYLQQVAADPITDWFTELLREKAAEVELERQRVDRLTHALQMWHEARVAGPEVPTAADLQLISVLQAMEIVPS